MTNSITLINGIIFLISLLFNIYLVYFLVTKIVFKNHFPLYFSKVNPLLILLGVVIEFILFNYLDWKIVTLDIIFRIFLYLPITGYNIRRYKGNENIGFLMSFVVGFLGFIAYNLFMILRLDSKSHFN